MIVTSNRQTADSDITVKMYVSMGMVFDFQAVLDKGGDVPITNRFNLEDLREVE